MFHLLENISENSKDGVRKLLYNTIKFGFEEADAQFNELCRCLYSEKTDEIQSEKESLGNEFCSVYGNSIELAKTIQAKQSDNTQVNKLLAVVAMVGIFSANRQVVDNHFSRPRGRPSKDLCYEDCIEPLKVIVKEIQSKFTPRQIQTDKKPFFNWAVAVAIILSIKYENKFYGCIAACYRYFERIGRKIPYGLRYFQMKIKEFRQFLDDKRKGGFYDTFDNEPTSLWKRRLKRFAPLEEIKRIITEKLIQFQLA